MDIDYKEKESYYDSDPIQRIIYKYIIRQKGGCVVGITGRANTGKSHTTRGIIYKWNPRLKLEEFMCYEVDDIFNKTFSNIRINGKSLSKEDIKNIIKNEDIREWCKNNIKSVDTSIGSVIMVDEAGVAIYNRDFFSAENKAMSKLVQIWRFMRMLVIFVVPERFEFVEKTMREFMDMKITMQGIDRVNNWAEAKVVERTSRDWKTGEPIFTPINGNKYGGIVRILPISSGLSDEYDNASSKWKTTLAFTTYKDLFHSDDKRSSKVHNTRIDYFLDQARKIKDSLVVENKKTHTNRYSVELVQNNLNCGKPIAKRVIVALEQEERQGINQ